MTPPTDPTIARLRELHEAAKPGLFEAVTLSLREGHAIDGPTTTYYAELYAMLPVLLARLERAEAAVQYVEAVIALEQHSAEVMDTEKWPLTSAGADLHGLEHARLRRVQRDALTAYRAATAAGGGEGRGDGAL